MAGREVREYTNLTDPKDKKWSGKGKDRIDDEEITFQRMVSKMQDVAGERGGYLHGRGALDSDDILYLKEQMEAEEDAERLLRRTEKRAFASFKKAVADASTTSLPLPLRVEPKAKSGIRQQDLLKRVVQVRPKRQRISSPVKGHELSSSSLSVEVSDNRGSDPNQVQKTQNSVTELTEAGNASSKADNPVASLLAATYGSSDDDD